MEEKQLGGSTLTGPNGLRLATYRAGGELRGASDAKAHVPATVEHRVDLLLATHGAQTVPHLTP